MAARYRGSYLDQRNGRRADARSGSPRNGV
jgi:hypothetical protein